MPSIHDINDCKIEIPDDMTPCLDAKFPGGYDSILYCDREICTFEQGRVENGLYLGPFGVTNPATGFVDQVDDLAAARAYIDALVERR
jgi:hypothetical protein